MATIKDLSKLTGLSLGTISNYLNGRPILPENTKKIEKAIKDLNYFPNNLGKHLRSGDTKTIGIIANDIAATYISKSVAVIEKELSKKKYKILFCNSQNDATLEHNNLDFMISQAVSAIIIFPVSYFKTDISNIFKTKFPLIMCDSEPFSKGMCHTVNYSNEKLAFEATELFIKEGHTRIACISGRSDHYSSISRISGYRAAMEKHKLEVYPEDIFYCNFDNSQSYDAAYKILKRRPDITACLITSNNMLVGFLHALIDNSKEVGKNMSYITFSSEPYYDILPVKPTYIMHDEHSIGQCALEILENILLNKSDSDSAPIKRIADSQIVIGDSHRRF